MQRPELDSVPVRLSCVVQHCITALTIVALLLSIFEPCL
jgi:hypothetical protein